MIPAAESLLQRIDRKEQRIAIDALHSDGSLLKGEGGGGGGLMVRVMVEVILACLKWCEGR